MKARPTDRERRHILSAAQRYRREGYMVIGPDEWAGKPDFLNDLLPDLIAERDDDRVVIEVKRATAIPGSNDLLDLASCVATQPGWRLELIALSSSDKTSMPDLERVREEVGALLDEGFAGPAYLVANAMIEDVVAVAAAQQNRNPANLSFTQLVRTLTVYGIIDESHRRRIERAREKRNAVVHHSEKAAPTREEVESLIELGYELQREIVVGETTSPA